LGAKGAEDGRVGGVDVAKLDPGNTEVGADLETFSWVENKTPRGESELKKSAGSLLGAEKLSGTPSQLISRRPVANEPSTPLLLPKALRKSSTADWIVAAFGPTAFRTIAAASVVVGIRSDTAKAIVTLG
jgi:hypothetical protein